VNDGDILKFLFNAGLEPFGIVEGEVVNESGNQSDVPDERWL
jgi:hypothetical protein